MNERRQEAYAIRLEAAELARSRNYPTQKANGDEQKYAGSKYFMSFTKGLPHEEETGLVSNPQDFLELRRAIDEGFIDSFTDRVRHGSGIKAKEGNECDEIKPDNFRQWEAPTSGIVYDLEGPDAQAVTMPPAPPLIGVDGRVNPELAFEMAEVYELAILRDVPLNQFEGSAENQVSPSLVRLNQNDYISSQTGRPRKVGADDKLDLQTIFRGSSPGVEVGPYLSQLLLIGTKDRNGAGSIADGIIGYGALEISQKVPVAADKDFMIKDFMATMPEYVAVQRGLRPEPESYLKADGTVASSSERPARRAISTPRDLATYVHYDELYEAYLNACLILLRMGAPFDPAFDQLSGGGISAVNGNTRRHASGFALFGGPHILTLVTEVATRALKAVRFQKFNNHLRLRPEALAARLELLRRNKLASTDENYLADEAIPPLLKKDLEQFPDLIQSTLDKTATISKGSHFLPMAFPEGSPMHPSYGAGHAAVAGACATILKAFFDTSAVLANTPVIDKESGEAVTSESSEVQKESRFKRYSPGKNNVPPDEPIAFRTPDLNGNVATDNPLDSSKPPVLDEQDKPKTFLTLEGELNKLAANISIGRNMAGVHFFSDYYDSLRMGEEIAIAMLEEQALTYVTDPFVLSVPTFDGEVVRIGRR